MAIKAEAPAPEAVLPQTDGVSGQDEASFRSTYQRQRDFLMAQPRQRIRLQEETFVSINGVNFVLEPKVWLDVPEQIAEILAEAGRI